MDGFLRVVVNKKYGIIDKTGKVVIPMVYDKINRFSEGLACVEMNKKSGIIDKTGKIVIPIIYDYIGVFENVFLGTISEGLIIAEKGCEYFILKLNL